MGNFFKNPLRPLALLSAYIALLTEFYSLMSGPLREFGLYRFLYVNPSALSRAGRIVMVYHTLAVPFVALLAILFVSMLRMSEGRRNSIVHALFFGSLVASVSGVIFAYYNGGMLAHGLFLFGLSVVFYGDLNLTVAVFSLGKEDLSKCGILTLEKLSIGLVFLTSLVSAAIGAYAGAFFGTRFKAFLAEDVIRAPHNFLQLVVISHLHIMLALIANAILLLFSRYYRLNEKMGRVYFPLVILGTLITSVGTWLVMVIEETAHKVINVGAFFLLLAALILAIQGIRKALEKKDRLSFRWINFIYLIMVNLFVTIPGIYVAFNLETWRLPGWEKVERIFAVGHWHILGAICALMVLNLLSDYFDIRGRFNNFVGWTMGIGATVAFTGMMFYVFRTFEEGREWAKLIFETGIGIFLLCALIQVVTIVIYGFKKTLRSWTCQHCHDFSLMD